jgi:transcriptional regulator with XRE-family HTH domain
MSPAPDRATDSAAPERAIGLRLRAAREGTGMSLRKLAKAVGISPSALSQIETERSRPSVSTLYALVSELGMSLDDLFGADGTQTPVSGHAGSGSVLGTARAARADGQSVGVQSADRRKRLLLESGVLWERLTPTDEPNFDFLNVVYEVGGASSRGDTFMRHNGREYGLVLEGELKVTVGFESHTLGPGDSIAFDSAIPHRLENCGDVPVSAIWVVLGRDRSDPRHEELHDD